jgi:transposase-like protein
LFTVYTDGFRAYEPLEEDDAFDREYVVQDDSEYADDEVHINTCESRASLTRRRLLTHRGVSKDKLAQCLRAFQPRRELYQNPDKTLSNTLFKRRCETNDVLRMSVRTI